MISSRGNVRGCIIVAFIALAVILATLPFADSAFDDDWAYAHVARVLQQTGQIHYNGWGASIGWFQSAWGALLISVFGFSFNVLRLGTAPFSMGCAVLMYLLARQAGLRESSGIFAAVAVTMSPYFIPLAASFMGDVYGLFFTELCLYCGVAALTSTTPRSAILWMTACAISGVIGGTTRQSVWPAVFAALGVVIYQNRKQRDLVRWGAGCALFCGTAMLAAEYWFGRQPNREFDSIGLESVKHFLSDPSISIGATVAVLFTVLLYAAPALLSFLSGVRVIGMKPVLIFLIATVFFIGFLTTIGQTSVAPFIANMVTENGILTSGVTLLGDRPVILSFSVRVAITAGLYMLALLAWAVAQETAKKIRPAAAEDSWLRVRLLLVSFAVLYLALIFVRANSGFTFDRYAIPVMPVAFIWILKRCERLRFKIPVAAWVTVGIFAAFGVGITHDYYAQLRARESTGRLLQKMGVPRRQMTLGLESDAWAELGWRGFVFNERSAGEAGRPFGKEQSAGQKAWWFTRHAPDIDPLYFVVASEVPELEPSGLEPIRFQTWLPMGESRLLIQKLPAAQIQAAVHK